VCSRQGAIQIRLPLPLPLPYRFWVCAYSIVPCFRYVLLHWRYTNVFVLDIRHWCHRLRWQPKRDTVLNFFDGSKPLSTTTLTHRHKHTVIYINRQYHKRSPTVLTSTRQKYEMLRGQLPVESIVMCPRQPHFSDAPWPTHLAVSAAGYLYCISYCPLNPASTGHAYDFIPISSLLINTCTGQINHGAKRATTQLPSSHRRKAARHQQGKITVFNCHILNRITDIWYGTEIWRISHCYFVKAQWPSI